MTTYFRTTDGKQVSPSEALDERGVLRSGHRMVTRHGLMDGRPVGVTDEQRAGMIDSYNARVSNAWRDPAASLRSTAPDARVHDEELAKIADSRERYERRITDAWRY
jgi:hypothetical protein